MRARGRVLRVADAAARRGGGGSRSLGRERPLCPLQPLSRRRCCAPASAAAAASASAAAAAAALSCCSVLLLLLEKLHGPGQGVARRLELVEVEERNPGKLGEK